MAKYSDKPLYLEGSLQDFVESVLKEHSKYENHLTIKATLYDRGAVGIEVKGSLPAEHIPELKERINVLLR